MFGVVADRLGLSKYRVGMCITLFILGAVTTFNNFLGGHYGYMTPVEAYTIPVFSAVSFLLALGYLVVKDHHTKTLELCFKLNAGICLLFGQAEAAWSETNNIEFYLLWIPPYYIALMFAFLRERRSNWGYIFFASSAVVTTVTFLAGPMPLASRGAILLFGVILAQGIIVSILTKLEQFLRTAGANEARAKILKDSTRQLKKAAEESEAARNEAIRANRAKSRFIANMSHELRTPLNAIIGFSEVLKEQREFALDAEKNAEYVEHIHESGRHLLMLVNDILDVAKIEAGKMTMHESETWLDDVVDMALTTVETLAAEKNITLEPVVDREHTLYADPKMLKQMVLNLVSNAVKFSQPGGRVTVASSIGDKGEVIVAVADTGVGMSEEVLKNIMRPFVQAEDEYTREQGGTGLGLYIVHSMMQLHGGKVSIDSEVGVGTTVTLVFPADRNQSIRLSA